MFFCLYNIPNFAFSLKIEDIFFFLTEENNLELFSINWL